MTLYFSDGSPTTELGSEDLRHGLFEALGKLGPRYKVLVVPPDSTRIHSQAGLLTNLAYQFYGDRITDVMPALGTHFAMDDELLTEMFGDVPKSLIRVHRWRDDVITLGHVPADFVRDATCGLWSRPWPVQMNRLIAQGSHDLILSVGQVVPHEVIGMANYNKNLLIGTGGVSGINESHYISALWGVERILGQADNPLRRILNCAEQLFCRDLPIVYVLTVVGPRSTTAPAGGMHTASCGEVSDELVVRGMFIGDDPECFWLAAELALEVNFRYVDQPVSKMVAYLDPKEFHSTWLGNKAVYRTRMAIADGGELIVLAPGVRTFGEDPEIDRLIRKYGYRTSPEIKRAVEENADLAANLSAAAHLMHGSSEGRFQITYCPGHLTSAEIESVGYSFGDLAEHRSRYCPNSTADGWHKTNDGEQYYFVGRPAMGLWAHRSRLEN